MERLGALIRERVGLVIPAADLERILPHLRARAQALFLDGVDAYLDLLLGTHPAGSSEWRWLIDLVATGESYFFRDQGQLDFLRDRLLPELIQQNRAERRLRIQ